MSYHQPTDAEVRARIMTIKDEKYRHAFMFQLICCARISEVSGKYAPRGTDVIETEFEVNGEMVPAVMFVVKTAKRKGRLRPCAVPLNPNYEPWAQPLLDYFKKTGDDYPFMFNEKPAHSVRYAQWKAQQTFAEMMWPMIEYTRTEELPYTQDMVLDKRYGKTGFDEYLVDLGGKRYWTYDKSVVNNAVKIQSRWKPFRSHALRKRRTVTLLYDYGFDAVGLSLFGGWTMSSQAANMPSALKHYLYLDTSSSKESFKILKMMATHYFSKLLKPYKDTGF